MNSTLSVSAPSPLQNAFTRLPRESYDGQKSNTNLGFQITRLNLVPRDVGTTYLNMEGGCWELTFIKLPQSAAAFASPTALAQAL